MKIVEASLAPTPICQSVSHTFRFSQEDWANTNPYLWWWSTVHDHKRSWFTEAFASLIYPIFRCASISRRALQYSLTDGFMVSQTTSFVPSIWSDSHSIWSSTIQSLIQISCGMVWDRLRVLVLVLHLRLFTGPPLSFSGPFIFAVGSLGFWITPKLSTHLLIKKGKICGAAMCTFPIHFVKHPIVFKHSETNNCLDDWKCMDFHYVAYTLKCMKTFLKYFKTFFKCVKTILKCLKTFLKCLCIKSMEIFKECQ